MITTLRGETRKTKHYFYREANNLYPSNDFMESFPEIKYEREGRLPAYFLNNNTYYWVSYYINPPHYRSSSVKPAFCKKK